MSKPTQPDLCYRYRTRALVGPWRATMGAALDDAIRAGQAIVDASGTVTWVIQGDIEQKLSLPGQHN